MNANRRISANDISNSSDLSNTFIVAMTRHGAGIDSTSAVRGPGSTPSGSRTIATRRHRRRARREGLTAWPESTVKSCPNARSKFERLSSSITSHWSCRDRLEEVARLELELVRARSARPPIVS